MRYSTILRRLLSSAWLATCGLLSSDIAATHAQVFETISVRLDIASTSADPYSISIAIDTLTQQLGTLKGDDATVVLSGSYLAEIDIKRTGLDVVATGLRLVGGDISQSAIDDYSFELQTGDLNFFTSKLGTELITQTSFPEKPDEIATVDVDGDGTFFTDLIHMLQTDGTATIGTPEKPNGAQDLSLERVISRLSDALNTKNSKGSLDVKLDKVEGLAATYNVGLSIPLRGQQLLFESIGLPVTVEFTAGTLAASGNFTLPVTVPEPTTGLLLLLGCFSCTMRPRGFCG